MPTFCDVLKLGEGQRLLAVAHDAGGANILRDIIISTTLDWYLCCGGPAKKILKGLGTIVKPVDLPFRITEFDYLVATTGWESQLEKEALKHAIDVKVKSIVLIDHWTNFKKRLNYKGQFLIPDQILVFDTVAEQIAKAELPGINVTVLENPYVQRIQSYVNLNNSADTVKNYALYVSEPIACHHEINSKPLKYDEFSCFEYFLKKMKKFDLNLILRLHPSEDKSKYNNLINSIGANIQISTNVDLAKDLAKAKIVVGCETMAMSIAQQLGIATYTSIDPALGKPRLPNKNIKILSDLKYDL